MKLQLTARLVSENGWPGRHGMGLDSRRSHDLPSGACYGRDLQCTSDLWWTLLLVWTLFTKPRHLCS
jgi:hypothetical protein